MTSRNSFYKLRLENARHRIGAYLVSAISFFIYLVLFVMSVQDIVLRSAKVGAAASARDILQLVQPSFGGFELLAAANAVLLAMSGFLYLHMPRKIDLYHSLPLRRRSLFFLILSNDLGYFAVLRLIAAALQCVIVAAVGYFDPRFFQSVVSDLICGLAVFAAIYLLVVLAVIMTGNPFVGMLGFGVFAFYVPVLIANLYPELARIFFRTFTGTFDQQVYFDYFSPLSLAGMLLGGSDWKWSAHAAEFAALCVWIAVLLILDYALFLRRPSETAGRAMAFPKLNPLIRIALVIPCAVYAGIILYQFSFANYRPWILVGVVIGTVLVHGVIESIYQFDVRGILSHRIQMLVSMAAAFALIGFFWADVPGFDRYVPEAADTESVIIDTYSSSCFWGKERPGVSGEAMQEMLGTLREVADANDENYKIYFGEEGYDLTGLKQYRITYRLKNGAVKQREYIFGRKEKNQLLSQIFDDDGFRRSTYSILTADLSHIREVRLDSPSQLNEQETLRMTPEQRTELVEIYREELEELDYETASSQPPFASLILIHREPFDGTPDVDVTDSGLYEEIGDNYYEEEDTYYIYPGFTKTIDYLRETLGAQISLSIPAEKIRSVTVMDYSNEDSVEAVEYTLKDQEKIRGIAEDLHYSCYAGFMGMSEIYDYPTGVDISLTVDTPYGKTVVSVFADEKTIEKIKKYGKKE